MKKLYTTIALIIGLIVIFITINGLPKQQRPDSTDVSESANTFEVVGPGEKQDNQRTPQDTDSEDRGRSENYANASWYDRSVCGERSYGCECRTANGEIFNDEAFTTACIDDFELGTVFEFCYVGRCASAVCNDRGDFLRLGRTFDFSRGLFSYFSSTVSGVIEVSYTAK